MTGNYFYYRRVLHPEEREVRADWEQPAAQLLQHQPGPAAPPLHPAPPASSASSNPASWAAAEEGAQSGRGDEEVLPGGDLGPDQTAGTSHRGRRGEDVAGAVLQREVPGETLGDSGVQWGKMPAAGHLVDQSEESLLLLAWGN